MTNFSYENKEYILEAIRNGNIGEVQVEYPNFIDKIMKQINEMGFTSFLGQAISDKRRKNLSIPIDVFFFLSVTAKMKAMTSLYDIPFALSDAELIEELGWNAWAGSRDFKNGIFDEATLRKLIKKYSAEDWIEFYNKNISLILENSLLEKPSIHILDCTKIPVNLKNSNYENSSFAYHNSQRIRGYKLGTLRGIFKDTGIIEEIVFGTAQTHDLELCRDMLKNSSLLASDDILIVDKGFLSREMVNFLKKERGVDVFLPVRKDMAIYNEAICLAESDKMKWEAHPNKKRKNQEIKKVEKLGISWIEENSREEENVELNACVVREKQKTGEYKYSVFVTTSLSDTGKRIIKMYEMRSEIEEDYRQTKIFWRMIDFKSTKYNFVAYHVVMTLIGYLYFQIFLNTEKGEKYRGKSLMTILKREKSGKPKSIIVYYEDSFGIFKLVEFLHLYTECNLKIRKILDYFLED